MSLESIYRIVDSHLFATQNIEEEYAVVVLEIMNDRLCAFYGGRYLVQHWTKKRKLFQTVHHCTF